MELSVEDQHLRGALTKMIANLGHAPTIGALAHHMNWTETRTAEGLEQLHGAHALLLQPKTRVPWFVPPFALSPGSCWVQTEKLGYWANCLYCAFGIAAALNCNATISTRIGGEGEPVTYQVQHGKLLESFDVFHLSTPAANWWDNVIFTCSSFQPFHSESAVDLWCTRHSFQKGAILSMPALWSFAKDWYGPYLREPWKKRTRSETKQIFSTHGLTGNFWSTG